jgi:hypothetical protein
MRYTYPTVTFEILNMNLKVKVLMRKLHLLLNKKMKKVILKESIFSSAQEIEFKDYNNDTLKIFWCKISLM